jgi:hypothetical protein
MAHKGGPAALGSRRARHLPYPPVHHIRPQDILDSLSDIATFVEESVLAPHPRAVAPTRFASTGCEYHRCPASAARRTSARTRD